jgi:hypothetical protein
VYIINGWPLVVGISLDSPVMCWSISCGTVPDRDVTFGPFSVRSLSEMCCYLATVQLLALDKGYILFLSLVWSLFSSLLRSCFREILVPVLKVCANI